MAQKSISGILIICFDLKRLQHSPDGTDDFLTLLILNQTLFNRNHSVGTSLINSRNNISLPVTVKYSMNFIPVKIRIFHSNYRLHIPKLLQKPLYLILFLFKLCGIRHTLILASTALFCVWTDCLCFFLFHKFSLIFILLFVLHNI